MRKILVIAVLSLSLVFAVAFTTPAVAKDGYAQAGCGLGSLLFGSDPGKFKQVIAATTNATFGTQTFGITTGTSNCQSPTPGRAAARSFIESNREALAKDISRGAGETIASLSTIAGCGSSATVGATLQGDFTEIFPNESVSDAAVADAIIERLSGETLSCNNLG
ncbi:DUF3015 domain-containing protein [bacterium]|nr:DUF3015 domain-containing protein [bacterium]